LNSISYFSAQAKDRPPFLGSFRNWLAASCVPIALRLSFLTKRS
jgi:hypothetical protein